MLMVKALRLTKNNHGNNGILRLDYNRQTNKNTNLSQIVPRVTLNNLAIIVSLATYIYKLTTQPICLCLLIILSVARVRLTIGADPKLTTGADPSLPHADHRLTPSWPQADQTGKTGLSVSRGVLCQPLGWEFYWVGDIPSDPPHVSLSEHSFQSIIHQHIKWWRGSNDSLCLQFTVTDFVSHSLHLNLACG